MFLSASLLYQNNRTFTQQQLFALIYYAQSVTHINHEFGEDASFTEKRTRRRNRCRGERYKTGETTERRVFLRGEIIEFLQQKQRQRHHSSPKRGNDFLGDFDHQRDDCGQQRRRRKWWWWCEWCQSRTNALSSSLQSPRRPPSSSSRKILPERTNLEIHPRFIRARSEREPTGVGWDPRNRQRSTLERDVLETEKKSLRFDHWKSFRREEQFYKLVHRREHTDDRGGDRDERVYVRHFRT